MLQNVGPHMLQKWAVFIASLGRVSSWYWRGSFAVEAEVELVFPSPSSSDSFRRSIRASLGLMVAREGIVAVYIMASGKHGTLYIGVTGNLARWAYEQREGLIPGFAKTYGCTRLVYWQSFERMTNAIQREKTMKRWIRDWKTNLIERENPNWDDLYGSWM